VAEFAAQLVADLAERVAHGAGEQVVALVAEECDGWFAVGGLGVHAGGARLCVFLRPMYQDTLHMRFPHGRGRHRLSSGHPLLVLQQQSTLLSAKLGDFVADIHPHVAPPNQATCPVARIPNAATTSIRSRIESV